MESCTSCLSSSKDKRTLTSPRKKDFMKTAGQQIFTSDAINQQISKIVEQVAKHTESITGVRDANPELQAQAQKNIDRIGALRGRPLYYPFVGSGAGRGPYVELEDGSVKMDLINGIGIHILGHGHPKIMAASVRGALSDVVMQGNLEPNAEYQEFSEKIVSLASKSSRLKYAWLATCGTMANENALKMSRQKNTPARLVVAFKDAFAGRSTMMAEITDNPAYKQGLPSYDEVLRVPFYEPGNKDQTLNVLKEHVAKHEGQISAFVFEPMLGEGGFKKASREFFVPLLEFCKQKKIAVWADEVQTFMRTGEMFAFETLGIGEYIDLCTVAKTAQAAVTLYTEEYNPKPGLIAGTFSGSTAALAAGIEIMNIISNEGYLGPNGKIQQIHNKFVTMLNELNETTCKGLLRDAGGMGLMVAVTPYDGSKEKLDGLLKRLYKNNLIAFSCGKDPVRVRFLIPAVMEDKDIAVAKKIIEKSVLEGV